MELTIFFHWDENMSATPGADGNGYLGRSSQAVRERMSEEINYLLVAGSVKRECD